MTKQDVVNQLYELSHDFNGMDDVSKSWLKEYIDTCGYDDGNVYLVIKLPDGEWFMEVSKHSFGWDYYIPDTREEEDRLWDKLGKG